MSVDVSLHTLPNDQPIVLLDCEQAFSYLFTREKMYAHYFSQACWSGSLIIFVQTSPESPLIFAVLHKIFIAESIEDLKNKALSAGVTDEEFTAFLVYTCGFLSNSGNYKGFGFRKIIPNLPKDKFEIIVKESKAYKEDDKLKNLWGKIKDPLYFLETRVSNLGLANKGVTTFFSSNCSEEDAKCVTEFMQNKGLELFNTRCFKTNATDDNYKCIYEIRLASIETSDNPKITVSEEVFNNALFIISRGDYNLLLSPVVENLKKAKQYAANETQVNMISKYIEHFVTGSLEDHKSGSRLWVRDKSPAVETNIGFTIVYKDPVCQRGEFRGFVAIVNRNMSKKFANLVNHAEALLKKLPWGRDFEKDKFLQPDFTSLDVLTFASSTLPCGHCAPVYAEIRQSEGFKNVSLGNVLSQMLKKDLRTFLSEEDQSLLNQYVFLSNEVMVGLHELLGHGSGKILQESNDGTLNFNPDEVKNPLTGESVTNYYKKGEIYQSVFGSLASTYEECRAEAVALYLSLEMDALKIFGYEGAEAEDIIYVNWLSLFWQGIKALESFEPSTNKWLQAHSQARYVLLRVCIEAGEDFIEIEETEPEKDLRLTVDRDKIFTVGKKAIETFLEKLQIYKSTADAEAAKEMYDKYSKVSDGRRFQWARWRNIVLLHKEPRKIFVQSNTIMTDEGNVTVKNYEPTFEGYIQSWIERFPDSSVSENLVELWEKDQKYFETAAA